MTNISAISTVYRFMYPEHWPTFNRWMQQEKYTPSFWVLKPLPLSSVAEPSADNGEVPSSSLGGATTLS